MAEYLNLARLFFRALVVNSLHFMNRHFRHEDTKTRRRIFIKGFTLCLGALWQFIPACPG